MAVTVLEMIQLEESSADVEVVDVAFFLAATATAVASEGGAVTTGEAAAPAARSRTTAPSGEKD